MDSLCMQEYRASMEGIYTTSISKATLDEAPSAYKPIEEIMENIGDTVEIIKVIKPLYNYKSAEWLLIFIPWDTYIIDIVWANN